MTVRFLPTPNSRYFHWDLAIVLRVNHVAGFEPGSSIFINSVLPEEAAGRLRGAPVSG